MCAHLTTIARYWTPTLIRALGRGRQCASLNVVVNTFLGYLRHVLEDVGAAGTKPRVAVRTGTSFARSIDGIGTCTPRAAHGKGSDNEVAGDAVAFGFIFHTNILQNQKVSQNYHLL